MNSSALSQPTVSSNAAWPLWQGLPRSLAEITATEVHATQSHASAVGQLLAFMKPEWRSADCDETADACLSAFVNSRLRMSDRLADQSNIDAAAVCLAETHQTLLVIIHQTARLSTWHQPALWHSRRLHCALLNHLAEHGNHPAIDDAFRAGCLTLHIPSVQLH
jgi:hypothetical protein